MYPTSHFKNRGGWAFYLGGGYMPRPTLIVLNAKATLTQVQEFAKKLLVRPIFFTPGLKYSIIAQRAKYA